MHSCDSLEKKTLRNLDVILVEKKSARDHAFNKNREFKEQLKYLTKIEKANIEGSYKSEVKKLNELKKKIDSMCKNKQVNF